MIYFTTIILTLFLSHIARATPSCGDPASPKELYDPTYVDTLDAQNALPDPIFRVTWSSYFDNWKADTKEVACHAGLTSYPHFGDIPGFPNIGGAYNVKWNSPFCGTCWNLTNVKARRTVFITLIDSANSGKTDYNISKDIFTILSGGNPGTSLEAFAKEVSIHYCRQTRFK